MNFPANVKIEIGDERQERFFKFIYLFGLGWDLTARIDGVRLHVNPKNALSYLLNSKRNS